MSDTANAILSDVLRQYGFRFTETWTGGGCRALEARLESGHWIVATDDGLCSFEDRISYESQTDADGESPCLGWDLAIIENLHEGGTDSWMGHCDGGESVVVSVSDRDAVAADLPTMVGRLFDELTRK